MSHDKIRAAARQRMTTTGEPYTAARRAAVREHQAAAGQDPPPGTGYALAMPGEIRDWLARLRSQDAAAAGRVVNALATLMEEGASLGEPMVASTAEAWPWALLEALDASYAERLEQLTVLRRGEADATSLVRDLHGLLAELEATRANLAGKPQDAGAAGHLAVVEQQAAEVRRLLPGMGEARRRLGEQNRRLQARVEAFRVRKEVLKASYAAASGSLRVRQAMATSGLGGDHGGRPPSGSSESDSTGADSAEAISAAAARLADLTADMEREAGQQPWPAGLMELRPGAGSGVRLLFAVEPAGTALVIAVLDGAEAVEDRFGEAVLAAAGRLRQVRAGQAPEAAAHRYRDALSFLAEFYPRGAGPSAP